MALIRNTKRAAAMVAVLVGASLVGLGCTTTASDDGADGQMMPSTTTTVGGAGPAVRVPSNEPAELSRLFAAWAIGQGANGYVGACGADPASLPAATTWCSIEGTATAEGQPFLLTHPGSAEPYGAVLIAPREGFYRIVDSHVLADPNPPAWVGSLTTAG